MDRRQLSTHLRALARSELAEEREADEAAARIYHERNRSLSAAITALTSISARLTAYLPEASYTGKVRHVAGDLVTLGIHDGTEVHLQMGPATVLRVDKRPEPVPIAAAPGPQSFIARLRQLEMEGQRASVLAATAGGPHIAGSLRTVAADHVVLETGEGTWLVPLSAIAAVITPPPESRPTDW